MIHFVFNFLGIIVHIVAIAIIAVLGLALLNWARSRVSGYRNTYDLDRQRKKLERAGRRHRAKLKKERNKNKQKTNYSL